MCTSMCKAAGGKLLQGTRSAAGCSVMALRGWGRGEAREGRGYIYCHITEPNTTLESNYTPIKVC